ncbi:ABC-three component system protein [Terasakiella pusilla]|uniref:ABC-three component system protein n=1 Tax=Terasakiella pusilla TaxID=64973 RepID=UPI003AA9C07E
MNQFTNSGHSAIGSALGYYYQGLYALVQLMDKTDDDAHVSVESWDDVYLEDTDVRELHQLKHSIDANKNITIKNKQIWQAMFVWADYCLKENVNDGVFILATVCKIKTGDFLEVLLQDDSDRKLLHQELVNEAKTVLKKRSDAKLDQKTWKYKSKTLPYEDRYKGCKAFLEMKRDDQLSLINNIKIKPSSFQIQDADEMVIARLPHTANEIKSSLSKRIIQWWDKEIVDSLTGKRKRVITKSELNTFITSKIVELFDDGLSDDMQQIPMPSSIDMHPVMKQQLDLVQAREHVRRRCLEREWVARLQRDKWIDDNPANVSKLENWDDELISDWEFRFDENRALIDEGATTEVAGGAELLKWSLTQAHNDVPPIRDNWNSPKLVHGSYQFLSKSKKVGWHTNFRELVQIDEDESS